mmetsp:Transcript_24935/g.60029  ORF Transcript_24935/g.60029 Transcript_24935/m.60029 type:complete len:991 (-) Transcript_24935:48-3020(-)
MKNGQAKRLLSNSRRYHACPSSPDRSDTGADGWVSAYPKSNGNRNPLINDDCDRGDSTPLGFSNRNSKKKRRKSSKKSVGKKRWNDGCSSNDEGGSIGIGESEDNVDVKKIKKGNGEKPPTKVTITKQPKKGEDQPKIVGPNKFSRSSLSKIACAGMREQNTPSNAPRLELTKHAETKVSRVAIPEDITTVEQLQWYRMRLLENEGRTRERLQPCRVLSPGEAVKYKRKMGIDSKNGKNTVIQYLTFPEIDDGIYKCIDKSSLIPFGYTATDGISTTFNDDYLKRYVQQQSKTTSPKNLEAIRLFMKRVFDYARETEMKSREQANKDLQGYYDDTTSSDDEVDVESLNHKRVQFEAVENTKDDDDDDDDESDNEADELDVPYTQAITFDPDDFGPVEEQSNEPIRPGDVIEYYSPIFVAGDARGLRQATVLSVDPNQEMPLVLNNGEVLPNTTTVKRIKVMSEGELVDHPGIFRSMHMFRLVKRGTATAADGIAMETARFGKIMQKNIAKMKEKAEADGFAPMDLLVNIKGANDDISEKPASITKLSNSVSLRSKEREPLLSSSSDDSSDDEIVATKSKFKKTFGAKGGGDDTIINNKLQQSMLMKLQSKDASIALFQTTKTNANKENNSTAPGNGKRTSLESLSLGSSFASSSSDDSSIDSTTINLGRNHKKLTQLTNESSSKGKKTSANSQEGFSHDSYLSSSGDDGHAKNIPQLKKMGKGRKCNSPETSPSSNFPGSSNNDIDSEGSLETPNSLGLTKKRAMKSSPNLSLGASKRKLKFEQSKDYSTSLSSSPLHGKNDKGRAVYSRNESEPRRRKSFLSPSSPNSLSSGDRTSSSSSISTSRSSVRKRAIAAKITTPTTNILLSKRPSSSDSVEIIENRSNIASKRPLPSSDVLSQDGGRGNDDILSNNRHKTAKEHHQLSDSPRSIKQSRCTSKIRKDSSARYGLATDQQHDGAMPHNIGWEKGKVGFVKSSAAGGFNLSLKKRK